MGETKTIGKVRSASLVVNLHVLRYNTGETLINSGNRYQYILTGFIKALFSCINYDTMKGKQTHSRLREQQMYLVHIITGFPYEVAKGCKLAQCHLRISQVMWVSSIVRVTD